MSIDIDTPAPPLFEDFYAATAKRTLALAYALTGSWGDAEDLVQDAFVAAHRQWGAVSAYDAPAAWVRRLVMNRAVSRWRRLRNEATTLVRLGTRQGLAAPDVPADDEFWAAIRRLPPQQARAAALFYVEDLSVEQIAQHLQCSTGSVKTHLSRARTALAELLGMEDDRHG